MMISRTRIFLLAGFLRRGGFRRLCLVGRSGSLEDFDVLELLRVISMEPKRSDELSGISQRKEHLMFQECDGLYVNTTDMPCASLFFKDYP